MPVKVDIVFCVDHTSSITTNYLSILNMLSSIFIMALGNIQHDVRIAVIKFRSGDDAWRTSIYRFTRNRIALEQWLNADQPLGGSENVHEAVGDALNEALKMAWRTNAAGELSVEKLVILITGNAPNGLVSQLTGEDPWLISKIFTEKDITLAVVDIEPSILPWADFYSALAFNTGGKYIPFVNAKRIIVGVIESVTMYRVTFRQAFNNLIKGVIEENSSLKYSDLKGRIDGMMNECETIADIQRYFYNQLHRSDIETIF